MSSALIIAGKRTPIGSFMGSLSSLSSTQLGSIAIDAAIKSIGLKPELVDEVIMGQVLQGGVGQAPARQAALGAGIHVKTPCTTVNKVCGSGLKAVMMAKQLIALHEANIVVAGGMESMTHAPYILPKAREGFRMGHNAALDLMMHDGLFDPYNRAPMGHFGDQCAKEFHFTKEAQDEFAKKSYEKAQLAIKNGYFAAEITPVTIKLKTGDKSIVDDEEPSRYAPDKMGSLRPAFSPEGTVTVANASKINDGAAAILLASEDAARAHILTPQARIIASATYAAEPQWFTTAPAAAIKKVCQQANVALNDIDLFEINEAFAVVPMHAIKELKLDEERVNIFGGAIALGHPIGASGARLVLTLVNALHKQKKSLGCISVCLGGGEAVAMLIERIS